MGDDVDFSADEVSMSGGWHTISNLLADEGEAVAPCVKIDPLLKSWTFSLTSCRDRVPKHGGFLT